MANATPPIVEVRPVGGVAKRKWSSGGDGAKVTTEVIHQTKRRKLDADGKLGSVNGEESLAEGVSDTVVDSRRVREVIESQFSLEILLKHDELRLINQELAKCQAALEQLRRCHLIPYPTCQGTSNSMSSISNGTGPALRHGNSTPQWAPAYGVTDGPYTKHYSKWLIPDSTFDGARDDWQTFYDGSRAGKSLLEGRSTRNSFADGITIGNKSRSQRGSTGQKLQALSSGYPQAKEKAGPCILKRGDGQMVKLVCNDCQRENFSSTQGFINHCRIAHRCEFKSHEEAAVASGQPIELDEMGGIVGEENTQGDGLVHPLIRSAPTDREAYIALLSRIGASVALFNQGKLPGVSAIPTSASSASIKPNESISTAQPHRNFTPSPDTPYLSNLMRNRGFDGNLTDLIGEAKTPVNFDDVSEDEESDDEESQSQRPVGGLDGSDSPRPIMRMPARGDISSTPFGRPGSSKGAEGNYGRQPGISPRLSYSTPVTNATGSGNHPKPSLLLIDSQSDEFEGRSPDADSDMMGPSLVDLSPNTVASNNAPSLVSDDGEYDEGDDAESTTSEGEEEDSDVAEIDIEDGEVEKVVPRAVLRNRSGSGGDSMRMRKEEKHVTFVSPVKERKVKERRS